MPSALDLSSFDFDGGSGYEHDDTPKAFRRLMNRMKPNSSPRRDYEAQPFHEKKRQISTSNSTRNDSNGTNNASGFVPSKPPTSDSPTTSNMRAKRKAHLKKRDALKKAKRSSTYEPAAVEQGNDVIEELGSDAEIDEDSLELLKQSQNQGSNRSSEPKAFWTPKPLNAKEAVQKPPRITHLPKEFKIKTRK